MTGLPINGRVAIIDDQIDQAKPLMQELSKRRIPFTYYDGRSENIPEDAICANEIRVLFLDINLIDNQVHSVKELYATVHANIDRIISENNFPYILICWSRHEKEYNEIKDKLEKDLPNKKSIASISLVKSDFFALDGNKTSNYDDKINQLFDVIETLMSKHITFQNLLIWENHIHIATNKALSESVSIINQDWNKSADWIFTKWGMAFAGKNFDSQSDKEKVIAAYRTLNHFLHETIEEEIEKTDSTVKFAVEKDSDLSLSKFNEKLLFSFVQTKSKESGRIVITPEDYSEFKETLNYAINGEDQELRNKLQGIGDDPNKIKTIKNKYYKEKRQAIRNDWDIFKLVINPVCDFVQNKLKRNRVIPGIFIKKEYRELINDKTDALYVSPNFHYSKKNSEYFFILDFRYFTSEKEDNGESRLKLKQQVLSEILSKLSRHINRQGIIFIDE
jgi:hypothetical protein